jgi:hypothetical protein
MRADARAQHVASPRRRPGFDGAPTIDLEGELERDSDSAVHYLPVERRALRRARPGRGGTRGGRGSRPRRRLGGALGIPTARDSHHGREKDEPPARAGTHAHQEARRESEAIERFHGADSIRGCCPGARTPRHAFSQLGLRCCSVQSRSDPGVGQEGAELLDRSEAVERHGEALVVVDGLPAGQSRARLGESSEGVLGPELLAVDAMAAFYLAVLLGPQGRCLFAAGEWETEGRAVVQRRNAGSTPGCSEGTAAGCGSECSRRGRCTGSPCWPRS